MFLESKVQLRREATRVAAKAILADMASGWTEIYLGYRGLYRFWYADNAAIQQLRPLFRIPGIEADGSISVDDEFVGGCLSL